MAEITADGITGTTLQEYLAEIQARYEAIDPDWNIEPESPDGQAISIWSETLALLDEQVQYAYMSRDPATATGQALNDIAAYAGLERQDATFSTATVVITGVDGTVIQAGSRVRNSDTGTTWALDEDVEIDGPTTANATATERGALTAAIGTLTEIADPVAGWQSVTNDEAAAIGRDEESDNQFRLRRNRSVALPGRNQVDNIFAAVSNVDGVTQVRVYENPEPTTDSNGLAPHSIAVFVQGGEVEAILEAIAANKNPGCGMNRYSGFPNTISEDTTTPLGNPVNITFFRPELISIYDVVTINTTEMSEATKETIKQAIVDFSLEGFIPGEGFTKRGFRIGERVAAGKLYTPVNNIVGDQGATESITVGTDPDPTGAVVPIDFNQLAVFDVANIEVEYVT
ncbi:phage baseplate protein [Billgrantia tianxiuensis]|uniref:Phage baseplate protein n=1 Tax=Billgrantia tianxiuensis TaxID=2497861 RepID=A0A6I6SLL7_9GAMM|nr:MULTISPECIES: baseplate J/gp47 family protein [Halomonas]MCE8034626.1 phage baseplate protein [Halomonas sp. MCCC 1A11057]QHC50492.1 phage baseplate protein [Halomonas tianxiuensis]